MLHSSLPLLSECILVTSLTFLSSFFRDSPPTWGRPERESSSKLGVSQPAVVFLVVLRERGDEVGRRAVWKKRRGKATKWENVVF